MSIRLQVLAAGTGSVRLAVAAAVPQIKVIGNTKATLKPMALDGIATSETFHVTVLATNACDGELELVVTDRSGGHCAPRVPVRVRGGDGA